MKKNNIINLIEDYTKHLKDDSYSSLTINQYHRTLLNIVDTIGVKNIQNFSEKKLLEYRKNLQEEDTSTKTKNLKIIILRSFIYWANQQGAIKLSLENIKTFRNSNRLQPLSLISREELKRFLSKTNDSEEDLVVSVLYATGLRLTELTNIRLNQVSTEFEIVGKGNKTRTVFLPEDLVNKIKEYCETKHRPPNSLVFQITHRTIQRRIKQRGKKMGMSQLVTPHKLRHLYATHLYENGADLRTLQEILGHSSISTTQVYTHVNTEKMRETVLRCRYQ